MRLLDLPPRRPFKISAGSPRGPQISAAREGVAFAVPATPVCEVQIPSLGTLQVQVGGGSCLQQPWGSPRSSCASLPERTTFFFLDWACYPGSCPVGALRGPLDHLLPCPGSPASSGRQRAELPVAALVQLFQDGLSSPLLPSQRGTQSQPQDTGWAGESEGHGQGGLLLPSWRESWLGH